VIGGGIAGLGAAWLLAPHHRVTLLERNSYLGGHANTVPVEDPGGPFWVDTGFMVFNRRNYPLLCGLFDYLGVRSHPTTMSFSASLDAGRVEYAGTSLNTLFAQRRNLASLRFLRMVREILRFNREAKRHLRLNEPRALTLGEFLDGRGFGRALIDDYLLPMAAAIWSCPTTTMLSFPFATFARFFNNHGLLDLSGRPQWMTVSGGSRSYVERLKETFRGEFRTDCAVESIRRDGRGITVQTRNGERLQFDQVVLASHADESLAMLTAPTAAETRLLGAFGYQPNRVFLHTDASLMPRERRTWSSWNYLRQPKADGVNAVSVTYWMNSLQDLATDRDVFVSLNPPSEPRPQSIVRRFEYDHPIFDDAAIEAQQAMASIQGADRIWYCGSYLGYGFHEDGLRSAVDVARSLGADIPWATVPASPRPGMGITPLPGPQTVET
jgi:predicted NAD/FAD-binding protein